MNKHVVAVSFGVLSLVALGGCKQIAEARKAAEAVKAAASAVGAGSGPAAEEDKDAELGAKLGQYINCMNGTSKRVVESRNRYRSWIADEKVGPTGKEDSVLGLFDVNASTCLSALDRAKTMQPALPEVESASAEYRKALEELDVIVKQANRYYDQDDYKDDKMAKGKSLHPQLMNGFAKFEQVNKVFEDRVTTLNDTVNARQFARLEKDPSRRLQYLSQKSLNEAKALIKLTDIAELKELDVQKYDVALQNYDRALTELEQYAESHKAEVDKASGVSSYIDDAQTFLKAAKELLRRKRDNKDFNKESLSNSHPQLVSGHPAQVVDKYNDLIQESNQMKF